MNRKTLVLFPALAISVFVFLAAAKSSNPKLEGFPWPDYANSTVLEVPTIEKKVVLDGLLEDEAWESAGRLETLYIAGSTEAATVDASVRAFYDGSNLVLALDLPGARPADSLKKCFLSDEYDLIGSGPHVRICLDPAHGHGVYFQFAVDPAGRKEDLRVCDESWSASWSAAVDNSTGRWRAEILIPTANLPGSTVGGAVWGFNFFASGIGEDKVALSSAPIRINLPDAARFGHLLFKGDLCPGRFEGIKASLPDVHREQKKAGIEANEKMCGPELKDLPSELTGLAPGGKTLTLRSGAKVTCLGLDNPEVIRTRYPFFYEKYENPELQRLRKLYRLDEIIAPGRNEFEQILLLNEWLVEHVTFGSPPPIRPNAFHVLNHGLSGQTFFCTYLSFTLVQMYTSLGWTARKLTGAGHGTLDVWSNYWRKWMQIDPSHNSYFRLRGTAVPLNSNEIRREYWRNRGIDMEMVVGTEQKAERIALQQRARDGLLEHRQDAYAWVAYKTRNNFLEVPYAYRNFLYLMIEDEYNRGKKWERDGKVEDRYVSSILTDRVGDVFWTLNQAHIHLYDSGVGRELYVQLETVTPNFKTFEAAVDTLDWHESGPVFTWELHPGLNYLYARSINKFGIPGLEHKVVLHVE